MKISLIIAYYKNDIALELILKSLKKQSYQDFEVIIAEDDVQSNFTFIDSLKWPQEIKHVYQDKNDGFRKNQALNKAIRVSDGEYIVFIDGDCIPHKNYLKAFGKEASKKEILFGRRVMLSESLTEKLYKSKNLSLLSLTKLISTSSKKLKYSFYLPFIKSYREKGIWGSNWGVHKEHLLAVNGYDEDYTTAGVGEDNDIEWRLLSLGLKLKSIRFSAIQFHLHHPLNYSNKEVNIGFGILKKKKVENHTFCTNGLNNTRKVELNSL